MGKSLVIVESPAKAKTINKYLGKDFIVKSSVGHVRDLPDRADASSDPAERARKAAATRKMNPEEKKAAARAKLFQVMGIDPEHGWTARYEVMSGKEKVIDELKRLARDADAIYLATDLDREGEAIAWHLREVLGGDDARYKRVTFNEITKAAISEAFEEPGHLDMHRVNAQQARRFLDRVVGYMVSPLLWEKIARGLSAGRVQSVAVRLIVEREREIRAFIPEEYWDTVAHTLTPGKVELALDVAKHKGADYRPVNEAGARAAEAVIRQATLNVCARDDKPTRTRPYAPFITSTLQQAASTRLGFSVKKTMTLAQRLYEEGHITYMRTDSTNLSADAVAACRDYIADSYGERYLPAKPNVYSSREGAQEAHEAIRPSNVHAAPGVLHGLERDAERLYELIWRQFVACQMPDAEYLSTLLSVAASDYELRTKGRILKFDGFTRVLPPVNSGKEDVVLPDVKPGDVLSLQALESTQHFTKPPARFTEATLVRELEKRGIGRPSTYASIISTVQDRGYVKLESRRFFAEKIGEIVTDRLLESFDNLMDYSFTANMEEELDEVAAGHQNWKKLLDGFYQNFSRKLAHAGEQGGMRENAPTDTDIACPSCGRHMVIRNASTGVFLGCSGYALPPAERCKTTMNLTPGADVVHASSEEQAEEQENALLRQQRRCQKCSSVMNSWLIDEHRKLHICGNNPDCDGFVVEPGKFRLKGYDGPLIDCDKCGSSMQLKAGRFGKYFGCTNSECKNTRKLMRNGEPAPPREDPIPMPHLKCEKYNDHYLLRDGAAGVFLAASQFPKNRETRPPLVSELKSVRDQLPEKLRYLADAPEQDESGNATVVRFSRKTRQQYVMSEQAGKATGWMAFYVGDGWQIRAGAAAAEEGEETTRKRAAPKTAAKTTSAKTSVKEAPAKKASASKTSAAKTASKSATKTATKTTAAKKAPTKRSSSTESK